MRRQAVSSSIVSKVGYDEGSRTLEVLFTNGSTYQYFDVPSQIYAELMQTGSIGQYLNANIKEIFVMPAFNLAVFAYPRETAELACRSDLLSGSKHTNFENRAKSAESRAPEINGPFGEEIAGSADLKSGALNEKFLLPLG